MLNTNKKIIWLLGGFLLIEALSFLSFVYPLISPFVFGLLFLASLAVSIYSLEYGLLIILAELLIGSMGHLFYFSVGAYQLPIRIAIWSGLMAVFVIKFVGQLIKNKNTSEYWQRIRNFPLLKYFLILFALIIVGLANGFLRHHGLATIFNDFNAWLYFLLLFPLIAVYGHVDEGKLNRLRLVFLSGALWLSLETLFLLFVFTHNLSFTTEIYNWLRRTIVGEVTPTLSGWPRIFIQSQIYPAIAFFIIFWWRQTKAFTQKFFSSKNIGLMFMAGLFISSVLISFSRSFWVGLIVALVFALIIIVRLSGLNRKGEQL